MNIPQDIVRKYNILKEDTFDQIGFQFRPISKEDFPNISSGSKQYTPDAIQCLQHCLLIAESIQEHLIDLARAGLDKGFSGDKTNNYNIKIEQLKQDLMKSLPKFKTLSIPTLTQSGQSQIEQHLDSYVNDFLYRQENYEHQFNTVYQGIARVVKMMQSNHRQGDSSKLFTASENMLIKENDSLKQKVNELRLELGRKEKEYDTNRIVDEACLKLKEQHLRELNILQEKHSQSLRELNLLHKQTERRLQARISYLQSETPQNHNFDELQAPMLQLEQDLRGKTEEVIKMNQILSDIDNRTSAISQAFEQFKQDYYPPEDITSTEVMNVDFLCFVLDRIYSKLQTNNNPQNNVQFQGVTDQSDIRMRTDPTEVSRLFDTEETQINHRVPLNESTNVTSQQLLERFHKVRNNLMVSSSSSQSINQNTLDNFTTSYETTLKEAPKQESHPMLELQELKAEDGFSSQENFIPKQGIRKSESQRSGVNIKGGAAFASKFRRKHAFQ